MNWLLVAVALILIFCIYRGYRKGLLRMVYSMVSWVIMLAIVSVGTPYINDYLTYHTGIYETLAEHFEEKLQESMREAGNNQIDGTAQSEMQQLEALGISLPETLLKNVVDYSADGVNEFMVQSGVYSNVAQNLAALAVKGIAALLAWLLAAVVVSIIAHILGIVSKIPVIRGVNKYLGLAAGAVYGILLIWSVFCITALCAGSEIGRMLIGMISESRILTLLYENNMVLMILFSFL